MSENATRAQMMTVLYELAAERLRGRLVENSLSEVYEIVSRQTWMTMQAPAREMAWVVGFESVKSIRRVPPSRRGRAPAYLTTPAWGKPGRRASRQRVRRAATRDFAHARWQSCR